MACLSSSIVRSEIKPPALNSIRARTPTPGRQLAQCADDAQRFDAAAQRDEKIDRIAQIFDDQQASLRIDRNQRRGHSGHSSQPLVAIELLRRVRRSFGKMLDRPRLRAAVGDHADREKPREFPDKVELALGPVLGEDIIDQRPGCLGDVAAQRPVLTVQKMARLASAAVHIFARGKIGLRFPFAQGNGKNSQCRRRDETNYSRHSQNFP